MHLPHDRSIKPQRRWPRVLAAILVLFLLIGMGVAYWISTIDPINVFQHPLVKKQVEEHLTQEQKKVFASLPELLGFTEPKTYLLFFLNNTEMRPGGGFIGTYATIRVDRAEVEILAFEGIEVLDYRTPDSWKPEPPAILKEELGVDRWYLRDSNWSPDYPTNAKRALQFYKAEGGRAADDIDAVISFTGTALEELLGVIGPIQIQGKTFTQKNVIETLEYAVEYGYKDEGIDKLHRKQIIRPFFDEVVSRVKKTALRNGTQYEALFTTLAREKHLFVYSTDEELEQFSLDHGIGGEVMQVEGDYVMWVDANLAALKTDHAIKRDLLYVVEPVEGLWRHTVQMTYAHNAGFDWRTSRYRTYARVYVPEGAELLRAYSIDGNGNEQTIDTAFVQQGRELGKSWFGTFYIVEPKTIGTVGFQYIVPQSIQDAMHDGAYELYLQKQPGVVGSGYVVDIQSSKRVSTAKPAEKKDQWGDARYIHAGSLDEDREFTVVY